MNRKMALGIVAAILFGIVAVVLPNGSAEQSAPAQRQFPVTVSLPQFRPIFNPADGKTTAVSTLLQLSSARWDTPSISRPTTALEKPPTQSKRA